MNDTYAPVFDSPPSGTCFCCGAHAPDGSCEDCDEYECTSSGCKVPRRSVVKYDGKRIARVIVPR